MSWMKKIVTFCKFECGIDLPIFLKFDRSIAGNRPIDYDTKFTDNIALMTIFHCYHQYLTFGRVESPQILHRQPF